jgi:RHS repeat-associated protein
MAGRSYNVAFSGNQYKFGSKELDDENNLNTYWFEVRPYDARIGRFTLIDPLTYKYPSQSPYNYVLNNPMRFIDPTGMSVEEMKKKAEEKKDTKYGNADDDKTITKNMETGDNSDGSVDCSGLAYQINNADSDSNVDLPSGTAADQAAAFENAGEAGSYTATTDATQISEGDYVFIGGEADSDGNKSVVHVMVATGGSGNGKITLTSASSTSGKVVTRSFSTGNGNYLNNNVVGIGKVNRSSGVAPRTSSSPSLSKNPGPSAPTRSSVTKKVIQTIRNNTPF